MQGSRTRRQPDRKAPASAGDTALLARVAKRDRGAFRSLYDRYSRPVYRFLYRFSRRPELIEEAVNDVMLGVWENAASFGHRSKVSTWIMGIAYRKGLKLTEKERRHDDRFVNIESHVVAEFPDGSREPIRRQGRVYIHLSDLDSRELLEELVVATQELHEMPILDDRDHPEIAGG